MVISALLALTFNTAALFKELEDLRALDKQHPDQALALYKQNRTNYPEVPSHGLFEIHKIGFRSAIIMRDYDTITYVARLFQSPQWAKEIEPELPYMVSNFGIYYKYIGHYDLAEKTYLCAKQLASEPKYLSTIENNLAVLYLTTGQLEKAQKSLTYALKHNQGDEEDMYSIHANLAGVHYMQGQFQQATQYYKETFLYFSNNADLESAIDVGLNLLNSAIKSKDFDTFERFEPKVAEHIVTMKVVDKKMFLQWLHVYRRFIQSDVKPDAAIVSALIASLPEMLHLDIAEVIDEMINTLAITELSEAWQTYPKPWQQDPMQPPSKLVIEPIPLSWCDNVKDN